ncbi:hypothetical protein IVB57_18250 [Bradyrhizobium sp. CW9]|uniref:hypothetical protein n=1 Tax=Bradyrhizobium sp. CW9 TaxID=2782689 RepID=UPI001FF7034E|nr:hypothetical protein [Bradyrhizobium sp. CW9]MCK1330271.1 hypothetical protein [Bradyrhizobium sp. CW9]
MHHPKRRNLAIAPHGEPGSTIEQLGGQLNFRNSHVPGYIQGEAVEPFEPACLKAMTGAEQQRRHRQRKVNTKRNAQSSNDRSSTVEKRQPVDNTIARLSEHIAEPWQRIVNAPLTVVTTAAVPFDGECLPVGETLFEIFVKEDSRLAVELTCRRITQSGRHRASVAETTLW